MKILFVCLGNICRSPMAEAILLHRLKASGLGDRITVDSAGTSAYHVGEPAHPDTVAVLKRHGIASIGRARQVRSLDFLEFDRIFAMDRMNMRDLLEMKGSDPSRVSLFLGEDVPDPYYGGPGGFEQVFEMLEKGCLDLLASLK